jgi:hypothetical protein
METFDHESTPHAKETRRTRWRRRGACVARPLSARLERAAAILLRAALNFQKSQQRALFPRRSIELGHLWEACDELYGGRPPRGVLLGREAVEVARQIRPAADEPGADQTQLTLDEIKTAWWLARASAEAARQRETSRVMRAEVALATRKFFALMTKLSPPACGEAVASADSTALPQPYRKETLPPMADDEKPDPDTHGRKPTLRYSWASSDEKTGCEILTDDSKQWASFVYGTSN